MAVVLGNIGLGCVSTGLGGSWAPLNVIVEFEQAEEQLEVLTVVDMVIFASRLIDVIVVFAGGCIGAAVMFASRPTGAVLLVEHGTVVVNVCVTVPLVKREIIVVMVTGCKLEEPPGAVAVALC